jgi:predicted MPP superfamily phosphohydrolase
MDSATPSTPPVQPPRISRRRFFAQLVTVATVPVVAGMYATKIEPFWPRFPEIPVKIKGLPKSFEGYRIAQVTDMHCGHTPLKFLQQSIAKVAELKPDLVVFTGDLVHHCAAWIEATTDLVKTFNVPVIVTFGNHDYGTYRGDDEAYDPNLDEQLHAALTSIGATVLRNESISINHPDGKLWFAGLDDLWFGDFRPKLAFQNIPKDQPTIALSHNPDTAEMLADYHPDLILSGHTHGGQIRLPFYGPIRLNVAQRQYDWGLFQLPNSQLYVSSGIGYIRKVRFYCRPEVPIITLQSA